MEHMRRVLTLLEEVELLIKLEKCEFHVSSVEFLRYIVLIEGISID